LLLRQCCIMGLKAGEVEDRLAPLVPRRVLAIRDHGEKAFIIVDNAWVDEIIELHGIQNPHHSSRFPLR